MKLKKKHWKKKQNNPKKENNIKNEDQNWIKQMKNNVEKKITKRIKKRAINTMKIKIE
jgi:hypothetical protein